MKKELFYCVKKPIKLDIKSCSKFYHHLKYLNKEICLIKKKSM